MERPDLGREGLLWARSSRREEVAFRVALLRAVAAAVFVALNKGARRCTGALPMALGGGGCGAGCARRLSGRRDAAEQVQEGTMGFVLGLVIERPSSTRQERNLGVGVELERRLLRQLGAMLGRLGGKHGDPVGGVASGPVWKGSGGSLWCWFWLLGWSGAVDQSGARPWGWRVEVGGSGGGRGGGSRAGSRRKPCLRRW